MPKPTDRVILTSKVMLINTKTRDVTVFDLANSHNPAFAASTYLWGRDMTDHLIVKDDSVLVKPPSHEIRNIEKAINEA